MKILITGHREEKLKAYNIDWIATAISSVVFTLRQDYGMSLGFSGMASGVDLWFCQACIKYNIPYVACVPFETQEDYMSEETKKLRNTCLKYAVEVKHVKNSWMVEHCNFGIVVFDGNKGGTHNVLQQLVEKNMPFYWINPVGEKIWKCD